MKILEKPGRLYKDQKGATVIIVAIAFTVFIGMASLSVDTGMMFTAKNQLQSAVDASALAAASGLQVSQSEALNRGLVLSQNNFILNTPLNLTSADITFDAGDQLTINVNRQVNTFFSQFFGLDQVTINASATAILGNRDIVIVFDRSGSMDDDTQRYWQGGRWGGWVYGPPQPMTDTMNAAVYFVDQIQANNLSIDNIGLVSYSTSARLDEPLGRNFSGIRQKIYSFNSNGYTNIGQAIHYANTEIITRNRIHAHKIEILISDGRANRPYNEYYGTAYAKNRAQVAKDNRIKIYTISLGTQADRNLMQYIANLTGGTHYYSPTTAELQSIFQEISSKIPTILIG